MYHKITLLGNLGKDPRSGTTDKGKEYSMFSIATSESWRDASGNKHEKVVWWNVTVWGGQAPACNKYLTKGATVLVEGKMNADQSGGPKLWTKSDGTQGASYEITATDVKFIKTKRSEDGGDVGGQDSGGGEDGEIPF